MTTANFTPRAQWSSTWGYLLVTTGTVVGLGNIFGLPHFIAEYGSVFILYYLAFELLIGIPLFLSEAIIGRRGRQNPVGAISLLSIEIGASRHWKKIGWLCLLILLLILPAYSVEASFPFSYFIYSVLSLFNSVPLVAQEAATVFDLADKIEPTDIILLTVFLAAAFTVVVRGINRGLEQLSRIIVPCFYLIFVGLAVYAGVMGNFPAAVKQLTNFDFHQLLNIKMLFAAFIYAFFKLNVGTGIMIVYGSYLPLAAPLGRSALYVVLFDIIASLLAYFAIYPLVLNSALTAIIKLDYQTIYHLFTQVAGGDIAVILFFLAATLAAWMPTIAITESIVVTLMERFDLSRRAATLVTGVVVLIMATMIILSYSEFVKLDVNHLLTLLSDNILIPISALFTAIFIAWVVSKKTTFDELGINPIAFNFWYILVRYLAPVLCLTLLIVNLF